MPTTCMWNHQMRVPSYTSCAQYFDCSAQSSSPGALPDYITECPYPQLFSPVTSQCEHHSKVRCTGRTEPKAPSEDHPLFLMWSLPSPPGDYIQYRELCQGPSCGRCEDRHPSCVGRLDGNYLVPRSTTVFFVCQSERTINIGRCSSEQIFSNFTRKCEKVAPATSSSSSSTSFPVSNSAENKSPALTENEVRALFDLLRNTGRTPSTGIEIVTNEQKNTLSLNGTAVLWLDLSSDGKNLGKSLPSLAGNKVMDISQHTLAMDNKRNIHKESYSNGNLNVYSTKLANNPYSKIG
ncbi:chitin binding beak protein 1 [Plakobranchus ocellatus]|uniref:Chitin binding beak protein 1 n=1 Tax=Plakobranchus ocellatus TaxID=259542 RepID=A0AAV4BCI0_9GAST|nr:chitin binding beak protein 1 [Plakobranchus ocellatus]